MSNPPELLGRMVHAESAARWTRPDEYPLSSLRPDPPRYTADPTIEALSTSMWGRRKRCENRAVLSAGFLLVKPVVRPSYVSAELIPDKVISASDCICPQFPGPYAIAWCSTSDADRASLLAEVGISHELHGAAIEWATSVFGASFGWPGVFYMPESAREAQERFFAASNSVKVIGLGLPEQFAADFINEATPRKSPPGYAPNGESGYLECVRRASLLPSGGRILGFEPLNLQLGTLEDSWLCNGLEQHFAQTLQVRPSPNGLLASFDDAVRCCDEINREEIGAEPGPWYPFLLVEY